MMQGLPLFVLRLPVEDSASSLLCVLKKCYCLRFYEFPLVPLAADFVRPAMIKKEKEKGNFGANRKLALGMSAKESRSTERYVNYRKRASDSPDEWISYQIAPDVRRFKPIHYNKPRIWSDESD